MDPRFNRRFILRRFGQVNPNDQDCYKGLPPDLIPRKPSGLTPGAPGIGLENLPERKVGPRIPGDAVYVGRGFQGRSVIIGTTATLIQRSQFEKLYLILNPSRTTGFTNSFTVFSGNVNAAGNSEATPIGVANYKNLHFYLNATVVAGTWDIIQVVQDPITGVWMDVQTIFPGVVAPVNLYANVGTMGVAVNMAVRWNPVVAGNITFQLDATVKDGVIGSGSGLANTVFIGSNDAVTLASGYPILETQEKQFVLGDNIELWGIAPVATTINVFEL